MSKVKKERKIMTIVSAKRIEKQTLAKVFYKSAVVPLGKISKDV